MATESERPAATSPPACATVLGAALLDGGTVGVAAAVLWLVGLAPTHIVASLIALQAILALVLHHVLRRLCHGPHPWARWRVAVAAGLIILGAPALVFTLAAAFVVVEFPVTGVAAAPVLLPGDRVIAARMGRHRLRRGDLVVVVDSDQTAPTLLRVIGLPGDEVALRAGVPVVNGTPLFRQPIGRLVVDDPDIPALDGLTGVAERAQITYTAFVSIEAADGERPAVLLGPAEVFLLADRRDGAGVLDSRQLGGVPLSHVVGRPRHVWWSTDPASGRIRWGRVGLPLQ